MRPESHLCRPLTPVPGVAATVAGASAVAQTPRDLAGCALVTTSIRTNDTEVLIVDPVTGDAFNLTRAPASEERYVRRPRRVCPCRSREHAFPGPLA